MFLNTKKNPIGQTNVNELRPYTLVFYQNKNVIGDSRHKTTLEDIGWVIHI